MERVKSKPQGRPILSALEKQNVGCHLQEKPKQQGERLDLENSTLKARLINSM